MGFETYQNIAKQKLDALHDAGLEANALDQIEAFISSPDVRPAVKVKRAPYEAPYDDLQIWWEGSEERTDNFEHLCLIFACNSLSVSLEHLHQQNEFPLFPSETHADQYSLTIKKTRTAQEGEILRGLDPSAPEDPEEPYTPASTFISLHQGYRLRAGTPHPTHGNKAMEMFQPRFDHTLHILGFRAAELIEFDTSPSEIEIAS